MDASLVTSLPLIYSAAEGKQRIATSREECKKCPGGQNEKRKTDNKTNVFQFQMRLALIQCFAPFRPFPSATDQCLYCRNPLEEHVWATWFLLFQRLKKKKGFVCLCVRLNTCTKQSQGALLSGQENFDLNCSQSDEFTQSYWPLRGF